MVFQAFAVWPHLTVKENVAFPLRIKKYPREELEKRVNMALASTNMTRLKDSIREDFLGENNSASL